MKNMQTIAFLIIIGCLIIHGFWPEYFIIDKFSICLIILLAIPLLYPYLKRIKLFGAEFVFKEDIKKLDKLVQKSKERVKEKKGAKLPIIEHFETFPTKSAKYFLDTPNLALAALRIDIERVLALAFNTFFKKKEKKYSIISYMDFLTKKEFLSREQKEALKTIVTICNKAVHGIDVSKSEAEEIIKLTERLNKSFAVGYSINFRSNPDFKEHDLICEWEHCVEFFPLKEKSDELSCHIFGHDCPGGINHRKSCIQK